LTIKEAARSVCSCAHHLLCKVVREGERLGFVHFFDDEPESATYGQQIEDCPSCGERLGLLGLFAPGPGGQQNG
jgi:hypothetical protein